VKRWLQLEIRWLLLQPYWLPQLHGWCRLSAEISASLIAASEPPVIKISAFPSRIRLYASIIEFEEEAHAETVL
jgi:hypothetical protein